jgi:hypothetical protein
MSTYTTNLSGINTNAFGARDVDKYFNNFFEGTLQISSNIDTAIIGYFESVCTSKDAARALASAVIYTSIKQGINPMNTLDEFRKLPQGELDAYLAMFLNFERKGTSYLGITNQPVINKYISRSIIA